MYVDPVEVRIATQENESAMGEVAVIATDALISGGGQLTDLTPATSEAFNAVLPSVWSHNNPVDIIGDASPERYAKALPVSEGWPPFLVVVDVGHSIELYADFSLTGKAYLPFPDPRTFRLRLEHLADEKVRDRLRLIWTHPTALDPALQSAYLTRLGLEAEPPSAGALQRLHMRHVERVPYETLWIQLGEPWVQSG